MMPKVGASRGVYPPIKIKDVPDYSFEDAVKALAQEPAPIVSSVAPAASQAPTSVPVDAEPEDGDAADDKMDVEDAASISSERTGDEAESSTSESSESSEEEEDQGRDIVDFDSDIDDEMQQDDTFDTDDWGTDLPVLVAPDGWNISPQPQSINHSTLRGKPVLWLVRVNASGKVGWIRSEVQGGPPDPTASARGVTMVLRCTKRIDRETPKDVIDKNGYVPGLI